MRKWFLYTLAAGVAVWLLLTMLYVVPAGSYAIVTVFGKPTAIRKEPGLYIKSPTPFSRVNTLDARVFLYETDLIEYLTEDKKNLILQTFACWKIGDPLLFFQSLQNRLNAEEKIDDVLNALVGSTLGEHEINTIISTEKEQVRLQQISNSILEETQERVKDYGIEMSYVGFERLALPEDNAQSVYRRMISERSAIAGEYRALGEQQADQIRAEADRESEGILAEARKEAEILKGQGEAEAAAVYNEAYSKSPEFFKFLKRLETDKKVLGNKTTVILSTDSDLIKALSPEEKTKRE